MKKLYLFIFIFSSFSVFSQIEGSWSLMPTAGALGVGPVLASTEWWSLDSSGVNTRSCLMDDSIVFNSDGTYDHYMDGSTWLEPFQGMDPEGCGDPVQPHVGGNFNYIFNDGVLTVFGEGAHLGLAKVTNQSEDGIADGDSIVYSIAFSGNDNSVMTVDAQYPNGYWRYIYLKNGFDPPAPPVIEEYTVTFNVHTDEIAGSVSSDGIYIGGGFIGGNDALLLADTDGDGIWTGSLDLVSTGGHFTILNGNCPDYSCKENIAGQPCADPDAYDDRTHLLGGFGQDTTLNLQYGSCADPLVINEINNLIKVYPNPNNGAINISSDKQISSVKIYNMIGNLVLEEKSYKTNSVINIQNFMNGIYFLEVEFQDGSFNNTKLIKR
jgi:hypothetical protein